MWRSTISSEPAAEPRRGRSAGSSLLAVLVLVCGSALAPGPARTKVFLTVDEALALAFPDCEVERRNVFLTDEQVARARQLAGVEIEGALVHPYAARCDGKDAGNAYFDTHRVRTLPETLMVVVDPEGRVRRLEILAFREPEEYIPREIWYRQFDDQALGAELDLKRKIRGVAGATLTARATTDAVRRVLALDRVIHEEKKP